MDWGVFWTIAGVAVAIGFGVWGIYAFYQDHPRRRLEYYTSMRRLISDEWSAQALDVFYRGVRLDNPCLLELNFLSNSRAEIGTSLFDQGHPLAFAIAPRAILVSDRGVGNGLYVTRVRDTSIGTVVEMGPQKIERGATLYVALLSTGRPMVRMLQSPFPDKIEIRQVSRPELRRKWTSVVLGWVRTVAVTIGGVLLVFFAIQGIISVLGR